MRIPGKIDRENGQLSIDFMIGFSIFMIGFIFVAVMISGLLVHLQSKTIDYDAVAYRTSVVLIEDPGEPSWEPWRYDQPVIQPPNWHILNISFPEEKDNIKRLGVSIAKNSPGILEYSKVEKFFNYRSTSDCSEYNSFCNPVDYREKLIFGDYPYRFNITLKNITAGQNISKSIGPSAPDASGYIRRIVLIKYPTSMNLNSNSIYNNTTIHLNFTEFYDVDAVYRIDPLNDDITINLTNITPASITSIRICQLPADPEMGGEVCFNPSDFTYSPRVLINPSGNNTTMKIESGFFQQQVNFDEFSDVDIRITFSSVFNASMINKTSYFNYGDAAIIPPLLPAVMEVRIW